MKLLAKIFSSHISTSGDPNKSIEELSSDIALFNERNNETDHIGFQISSDLKVMILLQMLHKCGRFATSLGAIYAGLKKEEMTWQNILDMMQSGYTNEPVPAQKNTNGFLRHHATTSIASTSNVQRHCNYCAIHKPAKANNHDDDHCFSNPDSPVTRVKYVSKNNDKAKERAKARAKLHLPRPHPILQLHRSSTYDYFKALRG